MELSSIQEVNIDGSELKIAIILPYFNQKLGQEMLENAKKTLLSNHVKEENIELYRTAGALEIPYAAQKIITTKKPDAVIALGIIIRGETSHYDLVSETTYQGLMEVQLKHNTPVIFGILACENEQQAIERVSAKHLNKGAQAAQAALLQTII